MVEAAYFLHVDEKTWRPIHVQRIIDEQAKNEGLWFQPRTAPEAFLQRELRRLHKAIEEGP